MFPKNKKAFYILFLFMSPLTVIHAIPVEAGIAYSGGKRRHDSFDKAMSKYRSDIFLSTLNSVSVSSDSIVNGYEVFFRFPDVLAEHHTVGIALGMKDQPEFLLNEYRNDDLYQSLNWSFFTPYFLISYNFEYDKHPVHFLRRWNYEIGGAFGPVLNSEMNVKGSQSDGKVIEKWDAQQEGTFGMLYRVETSLTRRYFHHTRVRAGLRYDNLTIGGFYGSINKSRGTFFYTQNGGIIPLSLTSYNLIYVLTSDPYMPNTDPLVTIKKRIMYTSQSAEIFFAISLDTR